jgi:hypothetical protein
MTETTETEKLKKLLSEVETGDTAQGPIYIEMPDGSLVEYKQKPSFTKEQFDDLFKD